MKNRRESTRGTALLLAVLVLLVFSLGAAASWQAMHISFRQTAQQRLDEQAYFLAEAGLEHALAALRLDAGFPGIEQVQLGEGYYAVHCAPDAGGFVVESAGVVGVEAVERSRVTLVANMRFGGSGELQHYSFTRKGRSL